MRVAVVGTGISGLVCAHLLHPRHEVTIFEAGSRLGGHTNTVRIDLEAETHLVDTGFIVYNEPNYPLFSALLAELGVGTQDAEMSFSVSDPTVGLEYRATNLNTLFAQRSNLARPWFHRMLIDIVRFNRDARRLIDPGYRDDHRDDVDLSLRDFVARGRYSPAFMDHFLIPLGASIWSAAPDTFADFPAETYARFMDNHGLLRLAAGPQWRTVSGGAQTYVQALVAPVADRVRLNSRVSRIVRHHDGPGGVEVDGVGALDGPDRFDRVILACHTDQALRMLADPSPAERDILGAIAYQPNVATLHTDVRFLPREPRARASWNYHVGGTPNGLATLTYWMNRLQSIESRHEVLVTLNRHDEIDPALILGRYEYDHPVFDGAAIRAQRRRAEIQGTHGTYFAGAYWGYGFHEDGVRSAFDACRALGADERDRTTAVGVDA